jgi:uncharacterized membrane protein
VCKKQQYQKVKSSCTGVQRIIAPMKEKKQQHKHEKNNNMQNE